ncbi:MAG: divalent-cation tolerance protein CutA [Oscillospiraceae bacterium]|nr:divalent-cation tolerance protein CutA [Oscillospiraceae bacterium]
MAYALIITTCPDRESAEQVTKYLLENRLAACVQRLPVESTYLWQGEIVHDTEITLFIKTRAILFAEISAQIREVHPYELPEIIALPIADALPAYLQWIDDCTQ